MKHIRSTSGAPLVDGAGRRSNHIHFTLQDQGSDDSVDSDVNTDGLTAYFALVSDQSDTAFDAGFIPL